MNEVKRGYWQAFMAYVAWGGFPIFYKWLSVIPALEVLAQRIIWSFFFCFVFLFSQKKIKGFFNFFLNSKQKTLYVTSAFLIGINWCVYIYAISMNKILEGSLGYFISPLLSVLLGVFVYQETLKLADKIALALMAIGIILQIYSLGEFPILAIALAVTFSLYGLLRKRMQADSLMSMTMETSVLFPMCAVYMVYLITQGRVVSFESGPWILAGVIFSGVVTLTPLILFSSAAKVLPLSHLGFIQLLAPSIQFLSGYFIYGEPVDRQRFYSFFFIWIACLVFAFGKLYKKKPVVSPY